MKKLALVLVSATAVLTMSLAIDKALGLQLDTDHSSVTFKVPMMGGISHFSGSFNKFKADIHYDPQNIGASTLVATIDPNSVYTGAEARDHEMRAKAFFDVKEYPEIKFVSNKVERKGKGFAATGNLSLRGVTREVTIPFKLLGVSKDPQGNPTYGFEGSLHINRKDYGLNWQMPKTTNWLGDDVEIDLSVLAEPQ